MITKILRSIESEENFRLFRAYVVKMACDLGVDNTVLLCSRNTPNRYEINVGEGDFLKVLTNLLEAFYLITSAIQAHC